MAETVDTTEPATEKKFRETGFSIPIDFHHVYFVSGRSIYRVKKTHLIMAKSLKDENLRIRARNYNRKLRERIGVVPEAVFEERHIYCFNREGMLLDFGELKGNPASHDKKSIVGVK